MKLSVRRLIAYWLDIVLLALVLVSLQGLLYKTTSGFPFELLNKGYQIEIWVLLSFSLPVWLYFICTELYKQQTIGKRILRINVINRVGTRLTFKQVFLRTLFRLLPWELTHIIILIPKPWFSMEIQPENMFLIYIPNIIMLLYIVILFASKGEKGFHDYIAKTMVKTIKGNS